MTPKGLVRFVMAYIASSLSMAALALAIAVLFEIKFLPTFLIGWSITVGLMGVSWSIRKLGASLGHREPPVLQVQSGGWRRIPIIGDAGAIFSDTAKAVIPTSQGRGPTPIAHIEIPDKWAFVVGPYIFPENQVKALLQEGWKRQRCGVSAFARSYWLDRDPFYGDRDKYEAWCLACEGAGFLINRKERHSGRLIASPLLALSQLRHNVKQMSLN